MWKVKPQAEADFFVYSPCNWAFFMRSYQPGFLRVHRAAGFLVVRHGT
jgi:hypothetical protein